MSVQAELDRYYEAIESRVPSRVARLLRWLRKPSSFLVRAIVAIALVVGGVFSFLPILGLWMLPLGLLLIAQDVPLLQKPLLSALRWIDSRWERLRRALGKKPRAAQE